MRIRTLRIASIILIASLASLEARERGFLPSQGVTPLPSFKAYQKAVAIAKRENAQVIPFIDTGHPSMEGVLHQKEYLVVAYRWENLRKGDIVIRKMPGGGLFVHQAVHHWKRENWITRGSNNRRSDPGWMTEGTYRGTVIEHIPFYRESVESLDAGTEDET